MRHTGSVYYYYYLDVALKTVCYYNSEIKQGELISVVQKFTPRSIGERKLVATFNSRELGDGEDRKLTNKFVNSLIFGNFSLLFGFSNLINHLINQLL